MAIIYLASASNSPGVTTTALGLALVWPRPSLVVEADPTGSSSINAGLYRAQAPSTGGLVAVAVAERRGELVERIPEASAPLPPDVTSRAPVGVLLGPRSHRQAINLLPLWGPMASALHSIGERGVDVIVDGGRLGMAGSAEAVRRAATLTVVVTRTSLPALNAANGWATTLKEEAQAFGVTDQLAVITVGARQPYSAREVSSALGLPVLSSVADNREDAAVLSEGRSAHKRWAGGSLVRSYAAAATSLQAAIDDRIRTLQRDQPHRLTRATS